MILQHMLMTAWNWRQSVCPGTSWRKSDTLELKRVKKQTSVIAPRKNMVSRVFAMTLRG